jgi:hypothetical protein
MMIPAAAALLLVLQLCSNAGGAGPLPRCRSSCGNVSVPFPFGIGAGCYHPGFALTCDQTRQPPRLLLGDGTLQIMEISLANATARVLSTAGAVNLTYEVGQDMAVNGSGAWGGLISGPYIVSERRNQLVVTGCNIQVTLVGDSASNNIITGCSSFCSISDNWSGAVLTSPSDSDTACSGIGCCETPIPIGRPTYGVQFKSLDNSHELDNQVPIAVRIAERGWFDSVAARMLNGSVSDATVIRTAVPVVLEWAVASTPVILPGVAPDGGNSSCPTDTAKSACRSSHSSCRNVTGNYRSGYVCRCQDGYDGNPYLASGCQGTHTVLDWLGCSIFVVPTGVDLTCFAPEPDVDECALPGKCFGVCTNTPGAYLCRCPRDSRGDPYVADGCIKSSLGQQKSTFVSCCINLCTLFLPYRIHFLPHNSSASTGTEPPDISYSSDILKCMVPGLSIGLGVGSGAGLLFLVLGAAFLTRKIKYRRARLLRHKFFKQNRGHLLRQLVSQKADIAERMIIPLAELEKATNNFDKARELGGGGHGTVYKGILSDLHVVAIKKSKVAVQREIDEFINEVAILSQINHRNVVKLYGCCLETEVPLLVYEFISNDTLYHHLHVDGPTSLPWMDRMRIATETARALSYLHMAVSFPIIHRDIKSHNILLDGSLTTKVSDFGASRCIPADATGISTAVQGTLGYLDPMYYYTGRLTEKSDVYSFGVVLIELLTRKKPYSYRSPQDDSLVAHFTSLLSQGNLVPVLDPQVLEEGGEEVGSVAALAASCVVLKAEDRPTMRNVEMTLEGIQASLLKDMMHSVGTKLSKDKQAVVPYPTGESSSSKESSRQYSLEEEFLLSARYPR